MADCFPMGVYDTNICQLAHVHWGGANLERKEGWPNLLRPS